MKTFYTIKDGRINRVQVTHDSDKPMPENLDWKLSPTNNIIHPDTPIERYDENIRYLTDEEWLKKQGKKDPSGKYYNKDRTKQDVEIYGIDAVPPGDEYTKEQPIADEPYQVFDKKKKK